MVLLEVNRLSYSYGERKAVDGVSFEIREGEMFGLLGANGAGKTTSISCIAGLLSQYQGDMKLEGRPFVPRRSAGARSIGSGATRIGRLRKLVWAGKSQALCRSLRSFSE